MIKLFSVAEQLIIFMNFKKILIVLLLSGKDSHLKAKMNGFMNGRRRV